MQADDHLHFDSNYEIRNFCYFKLAIYSLAQQNQKIKYNFKFEK